MDGSVQKKGRPNANSKFLPGKSIATYARARDDVWLDNITVRHCL